MTFSPAAFATIKAHLADTGSVPEDYDLIVTGDLGTIGVEALMALCREDGLSIGGKLTDCGNLIFDPVKQDVHAGGSGCGCSAVMLAGHVLPELEQGAVKRVLFLSTGALMSPLSACQGESIPGIAHAVSLVHEE